MSEKPAVDSDLTCFLGPLGCGYLTPSALHTPAGGGLGKSPVEWL
jgi:hypothetical protein